MAYAPYPKRFRSVEDIASFLEENYEPRCIEPYESLADANRRAGEVEIAQRIIATIRKADNTVEED